MIVCTGSTAYAADRLRELLESRLDPRVEYRTSRTQHFLVHYPSALGRDAAAVRAMAEEVWPKVTSSLAAEPPGLTHLVVAQRSDQPQVFTSLFPSRLLFFDIALPHLGIGLNDFASYHRWLLTHELTHVVQLEQLGGAYRPLAWVLGRTVRPATLEPPWIKEGLAVWSESTLTPRGRLGSTTYRMMARMAVAEGLIASGDFATPDTAASYDPQTWPWTFRPYLVGTLLMDEALKQDSGAPGRLVHASGRTFPYRIEPLIEEAAGEDFDTLWQRTMAATSAKAREELTNIRQQPLTELEHLTHSGFILEGLTLSHDGKWLWVTRENPREENALLRFPLSASGLGSPELIVERSTGYQTSLSGSDRFVAFDAVTRTSRHSLVSDIYLLDLKTRTMAAISPRVHARDPDVHPDGVHVVFVVNEGGRNRLIEADSTFDDPVDLLGDVGYRRISSPRYSPDGRMIAFTLRNPQTAGEDLLLRDESGARPVVADGAQNRQPCWTLDGRYVLYASDADGVFNIRALEVATGRTFVLTHVEGGLFWPAVDPSGHYVYVVSYRGHGDDLARFRFDPAEWKEAPRGSPPEVIETSEPLPGPAAEERAYQGLRYLAPSYVLPSIALRPGTLQVGAATGAEDPLGFYAWDLEVRYDTATKRPVGRLFAFAGATEIALDGSLAHDAVPAGSDGRQLDVVAATASASVPLTPDGVHLNLRPGGFAQRVLFNGTSEQAGPQLYVRYDTTFQQLGQSFPESGSLINVGVRHAFGNHGDSTALEGHVEQHVGLGGRRHALHLSVEGSMLLLPSTDPNAVSTAGGRLSFPFALQSTYTLFGYEPNAIVAPSLAVGTLHYTVELFNPGRGLGTAPLFFGRLSFGARAQVAAVQWVTNPLEAPRSIGAELHQELVFGYQYAMTASVGLYRGGPSGGETQLVFSIARSR